MAQAPPTRAVLRWAANSAGLLRRGVPDNGYADVARVTPTLQERMNAEISPAFRALTQLFVSRCESRCVSQPVGAHSSGWVHGQGSGPWGGGGVADSLLCDLEPCCLSSGRVSGLDGPERVDSAGAMRLPGQATRRPEEGRSRGKH
jgi:hypothetical protein